MRERQRGPAAGPSSAVATVRSAAQSSGRPSAPPSDDSLLQAPDGEIRTHACPICGSPALGGPRYPRAVCDTCRAGTVDSAGRLIAGYNSSLTGGFEARYVDDDGKAGEVCDEVTARGECWIDGRACSIGEARFGGVVVQAAPEPLTSDP